LFGTRRFETYKDELEARRREAQKTVDTSAEHARTLLEVAERLIAQQTLGGGDGGDGTGGDLGARRDAADLALQRADYRSEVASAERGTAEARAKAAQEAWM